MMGLVHRMRKKTTNKYKVVLITDGILTPELIESNEEDGFELFLLNETKAVFKKQITEDAH